MFIPAPKLGFDYKEQALRNSMARELNVRSDQEGWQRVAETWVYASASTVTVPATASARFQVYDKVRLKQADVYKYYYISEVTDATTLTLAGDIAAPLVNAQISNIFISRMEKPFGYPFSLSRRIGGTFVGEIRAGFFATAPEGWLLCNGTTIGNAASGATARANADTQELYTLLWTNISDTYCPVSSGRGASASADFSANKTLTLPDARQKVLLAKSASGIGDTLGKTEGALTHNQTMPAHYHGMSSGADLNITSSGTHAHAQNVSANPGSGGTGVRVDYDADATGASSYPQGILTASSQHVHEASSFAGRIGMVTMGVTGDSPQILTGSSIQPSLTTNFIIAY